MYFIVEFIQRKAHTVQVDGIVCFAELTGSLPGAFLSLFLVGVRMHVCHDEIRSDDNNERKENEQRAKRKAKKRIENLCNFQHSMCTAYSAVVVAAVDKVS